MFERDSKHEISDWGVTTHKEAQVQKDKAQSPPLDRNELGGRESVNSKR